MRRWGIPALVLVLHLLLVLGLRFGLQSGLRQAKDTPLALPASITFFLPPLARQPPAPKEKKELALRPAAISRPTAAAVSSALLVDATLPAVTTAPQPAPAAAEAAGASEAPRARLILTLPPSLPTRAASAPRNPALSDPRTNTARQTLEEKMASALDNTVHQQVQADGSTIRRRVGNECVDLHESRAVKLMPDVDFLRYAPRAAGPSYKCK